MTLRYLYHGTGRGNADRILVEGFKSGTYFTPYIDTAIEQGGPCVFTVLFPDQEYHWQIITEHPVAKDRIVRCVQYRGNLLYDSPVAGRMIRSARLAEEGHDLCLKCDGKGEIGTWVWSRGFCKMMRVANTVLCGDCGGYGSKTKFESMSMNLTKMASTPEFDEMLAKSQCRQIGCTNPPQGFYPYCKEHS